MKYSIGYINSVNLFKVFKNENEFLIDLNSDYDEVIDNIIYMDDNALLYQLKLVMNKEDDPDLFINDVFCLSFKDDNFEKNELIEKLFDDEGGFYCKGRDNIIRFFVPGDKSSSMSKDGKILFINKEYKDKLDSRLLLDFPFDSINNIAPSKYFAYRGLYLTDAYRVDGLELDENKVIVIDDCNGVPEKKYSILTAEKENGIYKFVQKNGNCNHNYFDGEGLISFNYINKINDLMNMNSTSIQIRMPFVKGMLHSVDFKRFFKEVNPDCDKVYIKDVFGIERDLDKVEIILTKSMFKCYKWFNNNNTTYNDIMKTYFSKFNEYKHALYICGSNTSIDAKNVYKKRFLNYQFLDTIEMSRTDFNSIVSEGIDAIKDVENRFILEDDEDEIELDKQDIYKIAITKNKNFLKEEKIKGIIKSIKEGYVRKIGTGTILTDGECRILSGDLLALLLHIYKCSNLEKNDNYYYIRDNCLIWDKHFYMPKNNIELQEDKYYAILRSPHLSRNEECLSKPYIQNANNSKLCFKDNSKTLMERYFGHLSGVIMVGKYSMFPITLGGADYDGDLVKIYSKDEIINGIKNGVYEDKDGHLQRKLPIIVIPSEVSNYRQNSLKQISFKTLRNTFFNNIGLISKLAQNYSELEKIGNFRSDFSARCSILAGLEIDAAKSGYHPLENYKMLEEEYKQKIKELADDSSFSLGEKYDNNVKTKYNALESLTKYYWSMKDDFKNLMPYVYSIKKIGDKYYLNASKTLNNKRIMSVLKTGSNNYSNLFTLPRRFVDGLNAYKEFDHDDSQVGKLFKFEDDLDNLDEEKLNNLSELIKAYSNVISKSQNIVNKKSIGLNKAKAYIYTTLFSMYGPLDSYSQFDVEASLDKTIKYLHNVDIDDDIVKTYLKLKNEINKDDDMYLLLFNPKYNDNDNPLQLFKYICTYVKEEKKLIDKTSKVNNQYTKSFDVIFKKAIKEKLDKQVWVDLINQKAKYYLYYELFNNDSDEAIKYAFVLKDKCVDFFWNVLDKDDIIGNIAC